MTGNYSDLKSPFQLAAQYRDYIWGGKRLRPGEPRTAEAWIVYENNLVENGPLKGQTLAALSSQFGAELLGSVPVQRTGTRFPLLVKLLDSAQWLSLQVHPDDLQAQRLEGAGNFGKTEAWHIIEAADRAQIIAGFEPGTAPAAVVDAIKNSTILALARRLEVHAGDTIFIKPGTLHALGPGLLIYEVQQTSDLTYRVYDWGRPMTGGRTLHIDKSIEVVNPDYRPDAAAIPSIVEGIPQELCRSPYFLLELLTSESRLVSHNTNHESFHALTVLSGEVIIETSEATMTLSRFHSALVPAACGEYQLRPETPYRLLLSRVPSV